MFFSSIYGTMCHREVGQIHQRSRLLDAVGFGGPGRGILMWSRFVEPGYWDTGG